MQKIKDEQIRQAVRKTYGEIAKRDSAGCGCGRSSCCGPAASPTAEEPSVNLGYSEKDVSTVPEGSNMGLGCGNPQAIASLKRGETVLDLGSGGGFDCFLAAKAVGERGPCHRRRYDFRDGIQSPPKRPKGQGRKRRVSLGRDRESAGC